MAEMDLTPGIELPVIEHRPGTEDLVRYAAAANDFAKIHYDTDHARSRGFDGVIVHGLLKAAYLGQVLSRWAGNAGTVREFRTEYRKTDRPGELLRCRGKILTTERNEGGISAEVELWVDNDEGQATTRGRAVVDFPA